jgi:hypothetical protein
MSSTIFATARQRGMRGACERTKYGPAEVERSEREPKRGDNTADEHVEDAAGAGVARRASEHARDDGLDVGGADTVVVALG